MTGTHRNITARKEAELALVEVVAFGDLPAHLDAVAVTPGRDYKGLIRLEKFVFGVGRGDCCEKQQHPAQQSFVHVSIHAR